MLEIGFGGDARRIHRVEEAGYVHGIDSANRRVTFANILDMCQPLVG
jgi:hypothetical protein